VCGPRYVHNPERRAVRAGHATGELSLGGRRVAMKGPRARMMTGEGVVLPSWERFQAQDPLTPRAVEQVLVGVATRKYPRSLEPTPPSVSTRGTSKSAASRRFVAATSAQVEDLLACNLRQFDLAAVMIDGIHVDEHVVLVALGIPTERDRSVNGHLDPQMMWCALSSVGTALTSSPASAKGQRGRSLPCCGGS
jgi:putative transposase